jgi:hypothetical protein
MGTALNGGLQKNFYKVAATELEFIKQQYICHA